MACETCKTLLAEGLDLCVRARTLDAQDRTNAMVEMSDDPDWWTPERVERRAARHNALYPERPMATRSGTIHLWIHEQYETDLADWERRGRQHLMQGCANG